MRPGTDATVPITPPRERTGPPSSIARPADLPERYEIKEVIGAGGMGRVYRAHDATLGRDVAVKVIESGPAGTDGTQPRDRFVREARAAARLAHPNIVAVHDANPDAGWLVMDLIIGESLRDVSQKGPSSPAQVRSYAAQVLAALDAAHAAGVIHRDIKPSNIIVDARGKVTLVDFGVARLVDAEVTRTGESLGTPAYMAPEQLRGGKVDERTDLYGLAATLFELVSGERMVAFESPSAAAIAKVKKACGRERGLAEVISRCLTAAPEQRIASARDALATLTNKGGRVRMRTIAVAVGVLAVLGGGAAVAYGKLHTPASVENDPRRRELFALTQSGEHKSAELLLQQYVLAHPDDADARMMSLLTYWWTHGVLPDPIPGIDKLRPVQRDMFEGLKLLIGRKESQSIAYLEDAEHRYPNSVEIQYALGEARWHGQQIERGVDTLERAFAKDPRWLMALHHVMEYRLARGETSSLRPLLPAIRAVDAARAATLECQMALSDRDYPAATALAKAALAKLPPNSELYSCLAQSYILVGNLDAAAAATKEGNARTPIDLEDFGLRTINAELLLYQGKLADYLASLPDSADRQRRITLAYWRTPPAFDEQIQPASGLRGQPIVPASQTLLAHMQGKDLVESYAHAFEAELRAYGLGLAAELHGNLPDAAAQLRRAMTAPAKGDIRLLAAHDLARVLYAQGDKAGAKAACDEVLRPHLYLAYRAALVPDCVLWTEDVAQMRALSEQWTGELEHPSVVEIRRRLATTSSP